MDGEGVTMQKIEIGTVFAGGEVVGEYRELGSEYLRVKCHCGREYGVARMAVHLTKGCLRCREFRKKIKRYLHFGWVCGKRVISGDEATWEFKVECEKCHTVFTYDSTSKGKTPYWEPCPSCGHKENGHVDGETVTSLPKAGDVNRYGIRVVAVLVSGRKAYSRVTLRCKCGSTYAVNACRWRATKGCSMCQRGYNGDIDDEGNRKNITDILDPAKMEERLRERWRRRHENGAAEDLDAIGGGRRNGWQ